MAAEPPDKKAISIGAAYLAPHRLSISEKEKRPVDPLSLQSTLIKMKRDIMRPRLAPIVLLLACLLLAPPARAEEPAKAAFLGMVFLNTSEEETTAKERRRLSEMEETLVSRLTESGRFTFIDTAPVADKASLHANLAQCSGCDTRLAAALGADLAVTGEVQKTSNLILSITIYIRDAETGALVGGGSADMRGNTDQTWARGIHYVIKNRILR